jgi:hypothetical protein
MNWFRFWLNQLSLVTTTLRDECAYLCKEREKEYYAKKLVYEYVNSFLLVCVKYRLYHGSYWLKYPSAVYWSRLSHRIAMMRCSNLSKIRSSTLKYFYAWVNHMSYGCAYNCQKFSLFGHSQWFYLFEFEWDKSLSLMLIFGHRIKCVRMQAEFNNKREKIHCLSIDLHESSYEMFFILEISVA